MSKARMRTTIKRSLQYWTVLLLGLLYISTKCDARAVNVSNSWTMPQEGLNVFYRFFRDRISWFEADAVCQFHHANLVTVDNSFQFDATRDLLRELDVNDIVWIGLMRPQSSDRFMWSNSRALAANTGYWAESLPLMESPLCAVIDPIRDYRWHALRCGGPETASFLCEMPVPSWAEACILKDLPSLTMQYMADTASIELIRNCGGEGLIRQMCRGKQDRERIMRELICPRERLESKKLSDVTNPHYKSLQIIRGISTDNNENNDIEMVPMKPAEVTEQLQTEKNTVQKLIEQFNVDELMQADQPGSGIPGEIPKPVKKSAKKIVVAIQQKKPTSAPKKSSSSRGHHRDPELTDLMMGDQPVPDDASNEIMEPLPHIKKVLPQDLKPMPTMKSTTQMELATSTTSTVVSVAANDETSTTIPVTSSELSALAVGSAFELPATSGLTTTSGTSIATTTIGGIVPATQTATIGHPMHPQQQRSNIITEEANHPHVKETNDNHFIPPMLLVKSHYVPPPKGHPDHQSHSPSHDITGITSVREEEQSTEATVEHFHHEQSGVLHQTTMSTSRAGETIAPQSATEAEKSARSEAKEQQQHQHQQEATTNSSEIQLQATTTARNEMTTQDGLLAVIHTTSTLKSDTTPEMVATATTTFPTERVTESVITTIGSGGDVTTQSVSSTTTTATTLLSTTTELMPSSSTEPSRAIDTQTEEPNKRVTENTTTTVVDSQSTPSSGNIGGGGGGDSLTPSFPTDPSTEGPEVISTTTATTTKAQEQPAAPHPTRNFLNEETYPPFKPNRRRSLTKPDTPSYFKKILG